MDDNERDRFEKADRMAEELDKLRKSLGKIGPTSEALSRLGYAAQLAGGDVNSFQTALQRLTRRSAEAA